MINSSVHMEVPASREFMAVVEAAVSTVCQRMRWSSTESQDLSQVALDAFGFMADDVACKQVAFDLRVESETLHVELESTNDLPASMAGALQDTAVGRVDRAEIDGSNRRVIVTKSHKP